MSASMAGVSGIFRLRRLAAAASSAAVASFGYRHCSWIAHGDTEVNEPPSLEGSAQPPPSSPPSPPPPPSEPTGSPCQRYNSLVELMYWRERPSRCAEEAGCRFDGDGIVGMCKSTADDDLEARNSEGDTPQADATIATVNAAAATTPSYAYPYDGSLTTVDIANSSSRNGGTAAVGDDNVAARCMQYNVLAEIFDWPQRRRRCNGEAGCVFVGRSVTGACRVITEEEERDRVAAAATAAAIASAAAAGTIALGNDTGTAASDAAAPEATGAEDAAPAAASAADTDTHDVDWDDAVESRYPVGALDTDLMKHLVQDTLTSSAVDSLRESQQLANSIAKSLVLEVLTRTENRGKLGELLQYTFAADTVLTPTRELLYWSLELEHTFKNIVWQVQWHRNYWLGLSSFDGYQSDVALSAIRSGGRDDTDEASSGAKVRGLHS